MADTKKTWFALDRHSVDPVATLHIYDEIGGFGVSAIELVNELKNLEGVDEITLRLNSPGGSIIEGTAIYNALKNHGAKIIVMIDGLAASMASVIAMAGDEIQIAENAYLMIHNPWTMAVGDAEELRKSADLLDKMRENLVNAYSRSGMDREKIIELMDAETWMTASEALENGFVDSISRAQKAAAKVREFDMIAQFEAPVDLTQSAEDRLIDLLNAARESESIAKANIDGLNSKIGFLQAEIENLSNALTEQNERHSEQVEKIQNAHAEELLTAKTITAKAVAEAAAELTAAQGIPAVKSTETIDEPSQNATLSASDYWAEWKRQPVAKRHSWHLENKHRLAE